MKNTARRAGYSLVLVLIFMLMLLSLLSLAYRHVGAALRVESVRSAQGTRDEGSLQAIAQALAVIGTGVPPSNPYVCGVTINTSAGPRSFTLTMVSEVENQWSVHSAPTAVGDNPDPLPITFLAP